MPYDPLKHGRRSIRLPSYDYSQPGAYFGTLCVADRRCIFGEIEDGEIRLSELGAFVAEHWASLSAHYPNVILDEFVILPNHVRGIIRLSSEGLPVVGAGFQPAQPPHTSKLIRSLPDIIRGFKTYTARRTTWIRGTPGQALWQRNYYEHIVRGEGDLEAIRRYIVENPLKWAEDEENPKAVARNLVPVDDSDDDKQGGLETRPYKY